MIARLQQEIQSQVNLSWSSSEDVGEVLTRAGTEILNFISSEKFGKLFRIVAAEGFRNPLLGGEVLSTWAGSGPREHGCIPKAPHGVRRFTQGRPAAGR